MIVERIKAEKTHKLRLAILRPEGKPEDVAFPLDDHPETLHVGIFTNDHLVGVSSIYHRDPQGNQEAPWWQVRGMAVLPEYRRQGLGEILLKRCIEYVETLDAEVVWCNARSAFVGFYKKLGFVKEGEEFEIEGIGPHYFMKRKLFPLQNK